MFRITKLEKNVQTHLQENSNTCTNFSRRRKLFYFYSESVVKCQKLPEIYDDRGPDGFSSGAGLLYGFAEYLKNF